MGMFDHQKHSMYLNACGRVTKVSESNTHRHIIVDFSSHLLLAQTNLKEGLSSSSSRPVYTACCTMSIYERLLGTPVN
jgi:hypothetical protein